MAQIARRKYVASMDWNVQDTVRQTAESSGNMYQRSALITKETLRRIEECGKNEKTPSLPFSRIKSK